MSLRLAGAALAAAAALASAPASARTTVCTVTVNSADEREVFREHLPPERYELVELAERGRPDWLGEACRRGVRCDVLLVSGHFAGTDFYSSKHGEHLPLDEIERVTCGEACPGLFSGLKEVYLFGCDTLKPEPARSAMPEIVRGLVRAGHPAAEAARIAREASERHAESARDRMRRAFPGVPLLYGFTSLAPYGRVAGPMLRRHFEANGTAHVGSGEPSAALLKLFGPASLVATRGQLPGDADAAYRAEACRYHDERLGRAGRLSFMRGVLAGPMPEARMAFDRIERFLASLGPEARAEPALAAELAAMAADAAGRERYLELVRATGDPALRARMAALARDVGWLDAAGERAELAAMIGEMLAADAADFGEVDLVCTLGRDRALASELERFRAVALPSRAAHAAALACLGNGASRARMLEALTSADEREVRVAHAYLRHHPIAEPQEQLGVARRIARMKASPAQVRALEALARQPLADDAVFAELLALFARSPSLAVQRAIAEVFLRAGPAALETSGAAETLRRHRLRSPDGADLIDALLLRLASGSRSG